MHAVSFNQVLGKRPIALLFSTPALCTSRVCGPVSDIMVELQHRSRAKSRSSTQRYSRRQPATQRTTPTDEGFHLETEPWLFTINAKGIIAARLEGALGINDARRALEEDVPLPVELRRWPRLWLYTGVVTVLAALASTEPRNWSGVRSSVTETASSQQGHGPPGAEPAAGRLTVVAILVAEVALLAERALVDGRRLGDHRLSVFVANSGDGSVTEFSA